jgi:hypothetical protein
VCVVLLGNAYYSYLNNGIIPNCIISAIAGCGTHHERRVSQRCQPAAQLDVANRTWRITAQRHLRKGEARGRKHGKGNEDIRFRRALPRFSNVCLQITVCLKTISVRECKSNADVYYGH